MKGRWMNVDSSPSKEDCLGIKIASVFTDRSQEETCRQKLQVA